MWRAAILIVNVARRCMLCVVPLLGGTYSGRHCGSVSGGEYNGQYVREVPEAGCPALPCLSLPAALLRSADPGSSPRPPGGAACCAHIPQIFCFRETVVPTHIPPFGEGAVTAAAHGGAPFRSTFPSPLPVISGSASCRRERWLAWFGRLNELTACQVWPGAKAAAAAWAAVPGAAVRREVLLQVTMMFGHA